MKKKRIAIALGHDALGTTLPEQKEATCRAAKAIADLIQDDCQVVITHSNGPQIGMIHTAMSEFHRLYTDYTATPMSVCSAMSQGYIGYDLQNAIRTELMNRGVYRTVSTLLTQVIVDPYDEAFYKPSKIIGRVMTEEEAEEEEKKGNVVEILPRKNALVRPAVANVDQALVIFAGTSPKPNLNLLDRFLLMMEQQNVPTLICFNKEDLASEAEIQELRDAYGTCGYPLFFVSARQQEGIEPLRAALEGKTTTVAGPSGVGKSTLINLLAPEVQMETGEISEKIQRGKHTTRHSQLILLNEQTYIFDTPGFSSLAVDFFEKETLGTLFPEFVEYEQNCRFTGCSHIGEPVCGVKEALAEGKISQSRYNNYVQIYNELKDKRKY